jgi:phenylalanyl-tRNA synthetase beta chain
VKLFEVSDVILLDDATDVGARNERRLVAVNCDTSSGFEVVHGLLNRVMQVLGIPHESLSVSAKDDEKIRRGVSYSWRADDSATYFKGRHASIYAKGLKVGEFGVVHPEVLQAFDILYPVSALEITLEPFVFDQNYTLLPTHM